MCAFQQFSIDFNCVVFFLFMCCCCSSSERNESYVSSVLLFNLREKWPIEIGMSNFLSSSSFKITHNSNGFRDERIVDISYNFMWNIFLVHSIGRHLVFFSLYYIYYIYSSFDFIFLLPHVHVHTAPHHTQCGMRCVYALCTTYRYHLTAYFCM